MVSIEQAFEELETLGFFPSGLGMDYRAKGLDLSVVSSFDVLKGGEVLAFAGHCKGRRGRTMEQYAFAIPRQKLDRREQLKAFLGYYLRGTPEECRPEWFRESQELSQLLPWGERTKPRPFAKCEVDADWFRVLRPRLKKEVPDCVDGDLLSIHFNGECARFDGVGQTWLVQASGNGWHEVAKIRFRQLARLRSRLLGDIAEIRVGAEKISIAGTDFDLVEPWETD